jgi:hypothetical protein
LVEEVVLVLDVVLILVLGLDEVLGVLFGLEDAGVDECELAVEVLECVEDVVNPYG